MYGVLCWLVGQPDSNIIIDVLEYLRSSTLNYGHHSYGSGALRGASEKIPYSFVFTYVEGDELEL